MLIHREGYDTAFLKYVKEHKGVGLTFAEEELKALEFLLNSSQVPDSFFWYWNDATNATGYTSKLVLMLVAVEALVNKSTPKGKPDKDWDKLLLILGPKLKKEFWGEKKNSHNALRHRLAHGKYFAPEHGGIVYVDIIHKRIVAYLKVRYLGRNVTKECLQEQFEKVVPAVIKAVLDFLQIHREVIFGNASVVIEDMFAE